MTDENALFYEMECGDCQQGSSSEGALFSVVPSARALSQIGVGPSGRHIEEVDSEETEVVYFEEAPGNVEANASQGNTGIKPIEESHSGEHMLLKNPRSIVTNKEVKLWRYLYKIPSSVEIRVPKTHERVDGSCPVGLQFTS